MRYYYYINNTNSDSERSVGGEGKNSACCVCLGRSFGRVLRWKVAGAASIILVGSTPLLVVHNLPTNSYNVSEKREVSETTPNNGQKGLPVGSLCTIMRC